MSFRSYKDIYNAVEAGKYEVVSFRKTQNQATIAGMATDLSMGSGNPRANFYIGTPLEATLTTPGGMLPATVATPGKRYLYRWSINAQNNNADLITFVLADYLMFYSFIDMSDTSEQLTTNPVSLSRYEDGEGVQMMAVLLQTQEGGKTFSVNYTNSDGVSGRITPTVTTNLSTASGTILNSNTIGDTRGIFIPLQSGDRGVRSIESVTIDTPDIGVMALVLVKPLANLTHQLSTTHSETEYLHALKSMPEIKDGAYLNMICWGGNNSLLTIIFSGLIEAIWS